MALRVKRAPALPDRGRPVAIGRSASDAGPLKGVVSLTGAGPGDPGLLTLRAAARLRSADVVVHDALLSAEILDLANPAARLIPVGKRRGRAPVAQAEIEAILIREARSGHHVVRLKGGDPFVFGRGGEEALALAAAAIPFEVIPGVSAGLGATASAGIPVTHRGLSGSVAFVTAHDLDDENVRRRLVHLSRGAETIAAFMAGAHIGGLTRLFVDSGLAGDTPAAVIAGGTTTSETVITGTLETLAEQVPALGEAPVLLVVGRTVALSSIVAPFQRKPAGGTGPGLHASAGWRVLIESLERNSP